MSHPQTRNFTNYKYGTGLGNVGSYQVSGKPFLSSSVVPASGAALNTWQVTFPAVTKQITVTNTATTTAQPIRVACSKLGLNDKTANYILVPAAVDGGSTVTLDIKATELYVMSDGAHTPEASVYAALTGIEPERVNNISTDGTNWSGSSGIG